MRLGHVIGRITLNRAEPVYRGGRWLVVSPLDRDQYLNGPQRRLSSLPTAIVYDQLGAGEGDIIGFVEGAEATAPFDHPMPIDAINAAIIEQYQYTPAELEGRTR